MKKYRKELAVFFKGDNNGLILDSNDPKEAGYQLNYILDKDFKGTLMHSHNGVTTLINLDNVEFVRFKEIGENEN